MSARRKEQTVLDTADRLITMFRAVLETLTPELAAADVDKDEIVLALGVAMYGCATARGVSDEKARRVVLAALREAAEAWERHAVTKHDDAGEKRVH